MPPKAKFSREEIIKAAVQIVESNGIEHLTARSLGGELGSSARPVFTVFDRMEDVLVGVRTYANDMYQSYVREGLKETIAFKGVGTAYIRFAVEHPKLFQLLFMGESDGETGIHNILGQIEDSYRNILNSIMTCYGLDEARAKELYLHMWIYVHGIAVLSATKTCKFSGEEISDMLTAVFRGLILGGGKK